MLYKIKFMKRVKYRRGFNLVSVTDKIYKPSNQGPLRTFKLFLLFLFKNLD